MMAESGDDANHESTFEIINAQSDSGSLPAEPLSTTAPSSFPNVPPPSAFPSFASTAPPPPPLPPGPPGSFAGPPPIQQAPPPVPPVPTAGPPAAGGNPFSIRAASTPMQHQLTATVPPVPPQPTNMMVPAPLPTPTETPPANPTMVTAATGQPQPTGGVEIPFDILSHGSSLSSQQVGDLSQQGANVGVWGWVRGAVGSSPLLSKMAETAKSSVDTVIATLDPQMKEYMSNQGLLDIVVTLDREDEVRGVREGLTRVFPAANIRPFVVAAALNVAAQTVGFPNAIQAAQQKIAYVRNSGYVDQASLVLGNEGFLVEAAPGMWLYMDCIILDDVTRQLQLHAFTQPVQVPHEIIQLLKDQTHAEYQLKDLGFAMSISHAMTHAWSLGPLEWQERLNGTARRELLKNAASALAYSYRTKV